VTTTAASIPSVLEIVYDDGRTDSERADHFTFERANLTLTRWELVLGRPREVVVRRLPLSGRRPVLGVLACVDGPPPSALVD
jgi:hypothetical protein